MWRSGRKGSLETQILLLERSYKGKNMVRQDKTQVQTLAPNLQTV